MKDVPVISNLNPQKRDLDQEKLAKFLELQNDVWADDLAPDYYVIDNIAYFLSQNGNGDLITHADL